MLFAGNSLSILALSMGAIWLERAYYATRPLVPPDGSRPPGLGPDSSRPDRLGWLGSERAAEGAGFAMTFVGFIASNVMLLALLRDGLTALGIDASRARVARGCRAWAARIVGHGDVPAAMVARQRLPWRPLAYFSLMTLNNGLFFFYRFRAEAMRDHSDARYIWPVSVSGAVAVAIYVAIQPHSISASEGLRGMVVTRHRRLMADAARFAAGVAIVAYAQAGANPDSAAELRAFLRSIGSFATAVANLAPLSPMRRLKRERPELLDLSMSGTRRLQRQNSSRKKLYVVPEHYWPMALGSFSLLGRLLLGIGAVPAAQLLRRMGADGSPSDGTPPDAALPPPVLLSASLGVALTAFGGVLSVAATVGLAIGARHLSSDPQFGSADRRAMRRRWQLLCAANVLSTCMVVGHRILNESQRERTVPGLLPVAYSLGAVGTGLQFYSLVNLFAWNQVVYGRPRWPYIEEILQGLRSAGEASWHLWVAANSQPSVNHIAAEALFLAGAFSFLLGWSIPTGIIAHAEMMEHEYQQGGSPLGQGLELLERHGAPRSGGDAAASAARRPSVVAINI